MGLFTRSRAGNVPCNRLPGLEFHVCALPASHRGPCRFEALTLPEPVVSRPDHETLHRRRMMVWRIADELQHREQARTAWGKPGLDARLKLGSFILDLLKRNQGQDGGQQAQVELP